MIDNKTAEIHTLTEYILNKDKQKVTENAIYEINQKILRINEEYDIKKKALESKYDENLENENKLTKQEKLDAINKLESELKNKLLEIVKGYENNSNINVDWDYLKHQTSCQP